MHVEIPLFIAATTILYNTCDTSNGALLLWTVVGYVFQLPILDWALLVRLVDNIVLTAVRAQMSGKAQGKKKQKRE